jgi:hypothetical protein
MNIFPKKYNKCDAFSAALKTLFDPRITIRPTIPAVAQANVN